MALACGFRFWLGVIRQHLVDELIERGYRGLVVGVLQANDSGRRFYESIGGQRVGGQSRIIGGDSHFEVFYGWPAIQAVSNREHG